MILYSALANIPAMAGAEKRINSVERALSLKGFLACFIIIHAAQGYNRGRTGRYYILAKMPFEQIGACFFALYLVNFKKEVEN